MTFAVPVSEKTPQSVLKEQIDMGARLMLTIPFGSSVEKMEGFISIMGAKDVHDPVVTFCIGKPTGGCILSTIVFDNLKTYSTFIEKLHNDRYMNFASLDESEVQSVRTKAVRALGAVGDARVRKTLEELVRVGGEEDRTEAMRALEKLR